MNSKEEILQRMAADIENPISKIEGSFTMDNLASVANELARFYDMEVGELIDRLFIDTASGSDLDRVGFYNHGVKRKEAAFEEVNVRIYGREGSVVDEQVRFQSERAYFVPQGSFIIGESGMLSTTLRCMKEGSGYRVRSGGIGFASHYPGLSRVENVEDSFGGRDRESDEAYRERILSVEQEVKGYGNISWYRTKAKEIAGIDRVKILDLARGLGTMDMVVIADGNQEATPMILQKLEEHIANHKMVGADILIYSATKKAIAIRAEIYKESNISIPQIQEECKKKIQTYFQNMEFKEAKDSMRISYAKVLNILLSCTGVQDVAFLELNGKDASIQLETKEFPYLEGDIELRQVE